MPIYEYVCRGCERPFEKLVRRFGDDVSCPHCESTSVDRQLSVFAALTSSPSPSSFPGCGAGPCEPSGGCGAGPCGGGACGMN